MPKAEAKEKGRVVLCLSGGMDSCVCAALAAKEHEVFAVHFSYGQRTEARELKAAEKIARDGTGRSWEGGAFAVQEMEGVGGVVKKKTKELIRVGKQVNENEDERAGLREYLDREAKGEVRSWCSWCERVVLSAEDLEGE